MWLFVTDRQMDRQTDGQIDGQTLDVRSPRGEGGVTQVGVGESSFFYSPKVNSSES